MKNNSNPSDGPIVPVETPAAIAESSAKIGQLPPGVWPKLCELVELAETLQVLTLAELDAMGACFRDMTSIIEAVSKHKREKT